MIGNLYARFSGEDQCLRQFLKDNRLPAPDGAFVKGLPIRFGGEHGWPHDDTRTFEVISGAVAGDSVYVTVAIDHAIAPTTLYLKAVTLSPRAVVVHATRMNSHGVGQWFVGGPPAGYRTFYPAIRWYRRSQ